MFLCCVGVDFFYILFYFLGENYVSPDIDLISISGQDGRMLSLGKKNFIFGIFGLLFAIWSMVYSWINQFLGGHRNFWSHSLVISTIGRMIWFNIPFVVILWGVVAYWGWADWYYQIYLDVYLVSLLLAQFCAWSFSDTIHLIYDSEWAKGKLYHPEKEKNGRIRKDRRKNSKKVRNDVSYFRERQGDISRKSSRRDRKASKKAVSKGRRNLGKSRKCYRNGRSKSSKK